jgi:hypothetical protein
MDQGKLGTAAKLLAKAEVTTFEPEAAALAERAYRLVADVLNEVDDGHRTEGAVPRRERRRLKERRAVRRPDRSAARRGSPSDAATNYRLRAGRPGLSTGTRSAGGIDLTA